jgi:hypothetical protein
VKNAESFAFSGSKRVTDRIPAVDIFRISPKPTSNGKKQIEDENSKLRKIVVDLSSRREAV